MIFDSLLNDKKLFKVEIPAGNYKNQNLGSKIQGVEGTTHKPWWITPEFGGIHVVGYGAVLTGYWHAASHVDSTAGYVLFEGITFIGGNEECVFAGFDGYRNSNKFQYSLVHFKNCKFIAGTQLNSPTGFTKWGVMGYHADLIFENCTWDFANSREHGVYVHSFGKRGMYIKNCTIKGVGAEGFKVTNRPHRQYYPEDVPAQEFVPPNGAYRHAYEDAGHYLGPDVTLYIENTKIEGWAQPHSWRGGAAIVVQGANANVVLKNVVMINGADKRKPTFSMDAQGEYFDLAGEAYPPKRTGPGNRKIVIEDCIMHVPGEQVNITQANDAESVVYKNCGIFGPGYVVSRNCKDVTVVGCNTPEIIAKAKALGVDTSYDNSWIFTDGPKAKVKEGLIYKV